MSDLSNEKVLAISVFRSADGSPLGKVFSRDADGNLCKRTCGQLSRGFVRAERFPSISAFISAICQYPVAVALGFGICPFAEARLVTAAEVNLDVEPKPTEHHPVVARTKEHFQFGRQPGVLHLDYDPIPGTEALTPEALVELVREAVPELGNVAIAVKASASGHIYSGDGELLRGAGGLHMFVPVMDASLIPEFGRIIFDRLWMAGQGTIQLAANGAVLLRTLIDRSVFSPERLCFIRAVCRDGLEQRLPPPLYFPGEVDDLLEQEGWLKELAPLSSEQVQTLKQLQEAACEEARPRATETLRLWAEERADARMARAAERGEVLRREAVLHSLLGTSSQVLPADLLLYPKGRPSITVAELRDDFASWEGAEFADPIEPDYGSDPRIAKAAQHRGEPSIFSFAHGGQRYFLRSDEERAAEIAAAFSYLPSGQRFEAIPSCVFMNGPPPEWFVPGVLPKAALGILYGASGAGKTFFVLDLVIAIASGRDWNGIAVRAHKIIYICAEGAAGFRSRLKAYASRHGKTPASLCVIADQPDLLTAVDVEDLIQALKRVGPSLIVIDTLAQVTPGADENNAVDMGRALKVCRRIHDEVGAMVLLVHHAGKDPTKGARGWSGLRAAADVEILVKRDNMTSAAVITKMKDGEDGTVYHFRLETVQIEPDEEGRARSSCIVEYLPPSARRAAQPAPRGRNQEAVYKAAFELNAANPNGVSVANVIDAATQNMAYDPGDDPARPKRDNRRSNAQRALDALTHAGHLVMSDNRVFLDASSASITAFEDLDAAAQSRG